MEISATFRAPDKVLGWLQATGYRSAKQFLDRLFRALADANRVGVDLVEEVGGHTGVVRRTVGHLLRDDDAGLVDAQMQLSPPAANS